MNRSPNWRSSAPQDWQTSVLQFTDNEKGCQGEQQSIAADDLARTPTRRDSCVVQATEHDWNMFCSALCNICHGHETRIPKWTTSLQFARQSFMLKHRLSQQREDHAEGS